MRRLPLLVLAFIVGFVAGLQASVFAQGGAPIEVPRLTNGGGTFNGPIYSSIDDNSVCFAPTTYDGCALGTVDEPFYYTYTEGLRLFGGWLEDEYGTVYFNSAIQIQAGNSFLTTSVMDLRLDVINGSSTNGCPTSNGDFCIDDGLAVDGHVTVEGTAPTPSACGTTPSVSGADSAGKVTIGTGVTTSCTVTFASAFTNAPACVVTGDNTGIGYAATTTTTVLTITSSADMDSDVISYVCIGL